MEREEYLRKLKELELSQAKQRKDLAIEYAKLNNPYNVGDIISDHIGTIKIESISFDWGWNNSPQCVYNGVILKKDLTPNKLNKKTSVYQSNIQ